MDLLGLANLGVLQAAVDQLNEWKWRFSVKAKLEVVIEAVQRQFRQADICALQVSWSTSRRQPHSM
jgi:hypothetical protein